MFARVIGVAAVLLFAILVLDLFVLRGRVRNHSVTRPWDVAPIIGFLGAVLLALAFVEAARREVMDAWRWGIVFGFLLSACAGIAIKYRTIHRIARNPSGLHALWRIAQTYGLMLLFGVLGVVLAVRVIGALLEVFIASALGVLVITIAVGVFAIAWRNKRAEVK